MIPKISVEKVIEMHAPLNALATSLANEPAAAGGVEALIQCGGKNVLQPAQNLLPCAISAPTQYEME